MSGGEGFSLPSFHAVGLGKHAVLHNCSAISDWANEENAVLVNPSNKTEVYDGMFFHPNQPFNQGNIYDWNEDEFISACEKAITRFENSQCNENGVKLQEEYSWDKTVNTILKTINES
ncbi:MAG: hypothetical protein HC836_12520 [Richelia sp. RM2_1_2]|nr:hypothetical protein [Richelia sp. RM2_1_2]